MHQRTNADADIALLSIVTSIYRSEGTISEFVGRALRAGRSIAKSVELIIVDDGSPDRSCELVRDLADQDSSIVLVQLSRNFGHHRALLTGLDHANGDMVLLIDSDLEEPPESLSSMLATLRNTNADCVYGVQRIRKGGWFERFTGKLFYDMFGLLSDVKLPRNVSTIRLMTKRYVNSLLKFRDHNPVLVPLSLITGYRQSEYIFDKVNSSETTYSIRRRFSLMLLAITSFSARPLLLMFWMSVIISAVSFLYAAYVVVIALTEPVQDGWSSLMAALLLFFSLNAFFTGVIGLYVKLILEEVKDRPRTVVQEIYRKPSASVQKSSGGDRPHLKTIHPDR
ncbi:glycosyltransferase family 2 protein [Phyllobacterium chamaecytisi]|uniref:glycosyltransferase family 2 protein n=1 Tax=Phyllobacterium chamaecytisi TaxID=2876082 RepID=UPI001CCEDAAF|nr:glycosyltransferase family 2 protein [Phyllobacterium sp. KW56]